MVDLMRKAPLSRLDRSDSWRRIRVGLAGLGAVVFILTAASAVLKRMERQADSTLVTAPTAASNERSKPAEPMAELGVAPGAAEKPKKP